MKYSDGLWNDTIELKVIVSHRYICNQFKDTVFFKMNNIVYFSYGSNMSLKRLQHRVSNVQMTSVGWLEKHKLEFHKKSNDGSAKCDAYYVDDPKHMVCGVLFEVTTSQLLLLDKYEGIGKGYERKIVPIITQNSEIISAVTYYATEIDSSMKPYQWYKEHVVRGAEEHNLPRGYIDKILAVGAIPDPDTKRHHEELIIYQ